MNVQTQQASLPPPSADDVLNFYHQLSAEGRERFICSIDPFYFFTRYVKTYDPYQGIQAFPDFPYLEHTIHALQDHRMNIFRKGRQLTFSWTFAIYGLWESQFQPYANSLYTSKRQEDSWELKDRAFFVWDHLPPWLRQKLTEDNKSTMGFKKNGSKLKFLPATDNVGRTFTAGHVYMDEFAHVICNAGKMYTSIKPTINAGGRCTIFSSPNGPYGKFYDLCGGDKGPTVGWGIPLDNGFVYHFMPYNVHPFHDAKWEKGAFAGMTEEEIDQEYRALWIKRGGRVYPAFGETTHTCPPFEIPETWLKVRALDFGGANPTAMVWMAFAPNGTAYIYREYKKAGIAVRKHAEHINNVSKEKYHLGTYSDHDSQNRIEYEDNGIRTQPAIKDWDSGYNEVTRHLMFGSDNKPGLFVFDDCKDVINEFKVYSWPEVDETKRDRPEKPLKLNDHLMDAIRYALRTTKGRRAEFKPVRQLSESGRLEAVEAGLMNPAPLDMYNKILIPVIGIGLTEIHAANGGRPIQKLGI